MWLLNTKSYQLVLFNDEATVPDYAILSHVWARSEDEVTYKDWMTADPATLATKSGYLKIVGCCRKAQQDGYAYVWIDT